MVSENGGIGKVGTVGTEEESMQDHEEWEVGGVTRDDFVASATTIFTSCDFAADTTSVPLNAPVAVGAGCQKQVLDKGVSSVLSEHAMSDDGSSKRIAQPKRRATRLERVGTSVEASDVCSPSTRVFSEPTVSTTKPSARVKRFDKSEAEQASERASGSSARAAATTTTTTTTTIDDNSTLSHLSSGPAHPSEAEILREKAKGGARPRLRAALPQEEPEESLPVHPIGTLPAAEANRTDRGIRTVENEDGGYDNEKAPTLFASCTSIFSLSSPSSLWKLRAVLLAWRLGLQSAVVDSPIESSKETIARIFQVESSKRAQETTDLGDIEAGAMSDSAVSPIRDSPAVKVRDRRARRALSPASMMQLKTKKEAMKTIRVMPLARRDEGASSQEAAIQTDRKKMNGRTAQTERAVLVDSSVQTHVSLPRRVEALWQCHCPDADPVVDYGEIGTEAKDERSIDIETTESAVDPRRIAIAGIDSLEDESDSEDVRTPESEDERRTANVDNSPGLFDFDELGKSEDEEIIEMSRVPGLGDSESDDSGTEIVLQAIKAKKYKRKLRQRPGSSGSSTSKDLVQAIVSGTSKDPVQAIVSSTSKDLGQADAGPIHVHRDREHDRCDKQVLWSSTVDPQQFIDVDVAEMVQEIETRMEPVDYLDIEENSDPDTRQEVVHPVEATSHQEVLHPFETRPGRSPSTPLMSQGRNAGVDEERCEQERSTGFAECLMWSEWIGLMTDEMKNHWAQLVSQEDDRRWTGIATEVLRREAKIRDAMLMDTELMNRMCTDDDILDKSIDAVDGRQSSRQPVKSRTIKGRRYRLARGITIDSGAADNVMAKRMLRGKHSRVRPSAASKAGVHYVAANDGRIPNEGEADMAFSTVEGNELKWTFQIAEVNKVLAAVSSLVDSNCRVVFDRDEKTKADVSFIIDKHTGVSTKMRRERNIWVVDAWVEEPEPTNEGFVRPS